MSLQLIHLCWIIRDIIVIRVVKVIRILLHYYEKGFV